MPNNNDDDDVCINIGDMIKMWQW